MLAKRIIPCLDVKDGRVVKGINFLNLRDAGDPVEQAVIYDHAGADELTLLDITASHEGRATLLDVVRRVADAIFIPFCVGGGIGTVEDIRATLLAGADKISLNSRAVKEPTLIVQGAEQFGSQCIVVAIDARWNNDQWEVVINGGRIFTGLEVITWAAQSKRRRGRNSADVHGCRRHARWLSTGFDARRCRCDVDPGDRVGRRGQSGTFLRCAHDGWRGCGAGRHLVSLPRTDH